MAGGVWLRDRTGLGELSACLRRKPVPLHRHTPWYYLGGAVGILFGLQVVTGVLLLLYYRPTVEGAHASVVRISSEVPWGWVVRSLHCWTADALIALVLAHFASTLALKSYRPPRELTWLTGWALLAIALGFGFTGYLLPWDELSLAATKVGTEVPAVLPLVGPPVTALLRGGADVTGDTLSRFFALHVTVLPLTLVGVVALHLWLVQRHGMSLPMTVEAAGEPPGRLPFYPDFLYREAILWLLMLGALVTVATLWPPSLGTPGDLLAPAPAGVKPEWYFLALYQTLRLFPAHVLLMEGEVLAVVLVLAVAAALLLLPFLDTRPGGPRGRWISGLVVVLFLYIAVMSVWGYCV
ncbi:MAG: cytochrome bc complex cytochrome b subunit [Gemmatimonadota bacterium]